MRIRLRVAFAGQLEQYDSPIAGRVLDVSDAIGMVLCVDGRAEPVEPAAPETAMAAPARERAVKSRGRAR